MGSERVRSHAHGGDAEHSVSVGEPLCGAWRNGGQCAVSGFLGGVDAQRAEGASAEGFSKRKSRTIVLCEGGRRHCWDPGIRA